MTNGSPSTGSDPGGPGVPPSVLVAIESHLRAREQRREELYQRARRLRRLAQTTMMHLHAGDPVDPDLAEIRRGMSELSKWLAHEGRGDESMASDALQEAVEATLLAAVAQGRAFPAPSDLGVEPEAYLLGLGDVVGEVRRRVLDALGRDDLAGAEREMALMESLTHSLLHFDTTRAIVPLKPKQDTARALLERTRGELVMARLLLGRRGRADDPVRGAP